MLIILKRLNDFLRLRQRLIFKRLGQNESNTRLCPESKESDSKINKIFVLGKKLAKSEFKKGNNLEII